MNIYGWGKKMLLTTLGLMFIALGFVAVLSPSTILFSPIALIIGAYFIDKAFNLKLTKLIKGVLK